jgi:ubiquinone/menaquinone biosynthesis C-methylase UbiE
MEKTYVQYGCGLSAPKEWVNFDVSPTLRIQKTPVIGTLLKSRLNTTFPSNVLYGDITKGLPIKENSCDGLYCSHTLEHLALNDFRKALANSYLVLKKGGIFRCVVPDIEYIVRQYIAGLDKGEKSASISFIEGTLMGVEERPKGMKAFLSSFLGNSHHLWMWDKYSLSEELQKAGFKEIRSCKFNDSEDTMFKHVEDANRFENAVAIECKK